MILDERKSEAFRKTINGFLPKQLTTKMVFQCLSIPQSSSLPRKAKFKKDLQILTEENINPDRLKVTGRQLPNGWGGRDRSRSNRSKIKTIRVVMDSPQKLVNALVDSCERSSLNQQSKSIQKIHIKTPKEIIVSDIALLSQPYLQQSITNQYSSRKMNSVDNIEYYQQLILQNPSLYKKIMLAYNAQRRNVQKGVTKINIRKLVQRKEAKTSRSVPRPPLQNRFEPKNTIEVKRNAAYLQFKQFQIAVSLTNKIFVVPPTEGIYKAYICKGNNGLLVKSLIKSRPWWSIRVRGELQSCNLVWTEWKRTRTTNNLPEAAKLYGPEETRRLDSVTTLKLRQLRRIAQKKETQMLKIVRKQDRLWTYCDKTGSGESYLSFSKKILDSKTQSLCQYLSEKGYEAKRLEKQQKIVNHIPGCLSLHSKKLLFYNLKRYYQQQNKDVFTVLPLTFHITKGSQDLEFIKFCEYYEQIAHKPKSKGRASNVWIIKPGENSNRGNGIAVSNSLSEITAMVEQKCSSRRSLIIQKYFENPFLYNKRKFDIRCYTLITTVNGIVKGYWYEQGYIRTSSKQFSLKNLQNKYVHLTNDAIQKKSQEYGKFQNFNKVSYNDFEKYVESQENGEDKPTWSQTLTKMKEIATDLIYSVATQLNPARKEYSFQIFGLDFMLDDKLNPFLIEANSNPCISVDGNVLAKIIPSMLENVIRLAIDPVFPPPLHQHIKNKYCFSNTFQSNKFSLVYDSFFDELKLSAGPLPKNQGQQELDQDQEEDAQQP